MEDAMLRGVTMEICGENCGILTKKLADGGRAGVKIGEGWRRGGRRKSRRRVIKDSAGKFMEYIHGGGQDPQQDGGQQGSHYLG